MGCRFPCVPGYHRIGIVEKRGKEVSVFQQGDVVYGSGGRWEEEKIISMWGAHMGLSVGDWGGYRFVASSMPNMLELETLAFTILAGVSNRGMNFADVRADQKVLIIGGGLVGVCAAQLAGLRGAQAIRLDKVPERIEYLTKQGYTVLYTVYANHSKRLTDIAPTGFDIVHDTVGHAATTDQMLQHIRTHGILLLQAQYFDKAACAIDLDQIKIRELTVKTTCGIREEDWRETMTNIRERRLKIAPLITHRFDANEDINLLKGYELLHTGKPFNLGMVFHWSE